MTTEYTAPFFLVSWMSSIFPSAFLPLATNLMTIITKEIKNTSRIIKMVQVGQFEKLDFTDQTLLANAPRPLAEKYNRSKILAS